MRIKILNFFCRLQASFGFVPALMTAAAIFLSFYSTANVSESIQAQNFIARVRRDPNNAVDRIFPERLGQQEDLLSGPIKRDYDIPTTCDSESCPIKAERSGYLQAIDNDALMRIAAEENLHIHLGHRPGNFITRGSVPEVMVARRSLQLMTTTKILKNATKRPSRPSKANP